MQTLGSAQILVDTPHQILVNKLCALLGRSELRDLRDVRVLLEQGADLMRGLQDAPRQDSGFSSMTLAWLLKELPIEALSSLEKLSPSETERLKKFRDDLTSQLSARIVGNE
jgi:hypothetical protein